MSQEKHLCVPATVEYVKSGDNKQSLIYDIVVVHNRTKIIWDKNIDGQKFIGKGFCNLSKLFVNLSDLLCLLYVLEKKFVGQEFSSQNMFVFKQNLHDFFKQIFVPSGFRV